MNKMCTKSCAIYYEVNMKTFFYTGTYQAQHWFSDIHRPNAELLGAIAHGVGIGRYAFDSEAGQVSLLGYTPVDNNPATLSVSPNNKYLYVAHETKNFNGNLGIGGAVSAYKINPENGDLTFINTVSACGTFTAYITTDKTGKYVIASNHGSYFYTTRFKKTDDGDYLPQIMRDDGSLALFRVREDGGLEDACDLQILEGKGYDVFSQASAHPHAVEVTRDDYVIAPNKGADTIDIFVLDKEKDKLIPAYNIKDEPGSAPRHLAIHPIKPMFFVMNEFNNKIVSYRWDVASGEPEILAHTFTVPMQFVGKTYTSCDIKIHPSGNFVYGTNHTFKSIVAYKVDQVSGKLSLIGNFREEIGIYREISIDLTGKYLVAGDLKTDLIDVFEINQDTGVINKSKHSAPAIYPSCIHFAKTN